MRKVKFFGVTPVPVPLVCVVVGRGNGDSVFEMTAGVLGVVYRVMEETDKIVDEDGDTVTEDQFDYLVSDPSGLAEVEGGPILLDTLKACNRDWRFAVFAADDASRNEVIERLKKTLPAKK